MAVPKLRQDLATADRHIAEGEARIAQQGQVVGELDADGHNTTDAQSLLRLMQRNLNVMNAHRQEIVHEVSRTPDEPIRLAAWPARPVPLLGRQSS